MSVIKLKMKAARYQVKAADANFEAWKIEYKKAQKVYDAQDQIEGMNRIFEAVYELDTAISAICHSGKVECEKVLAQMRKLYSHLLKSAKRIDRFARRLELDGYKVNGLDGLRNNINEVEGILTDDAEFFGDALTDIRDSAIDAHRAGQTEPMK